jgi:hypothetical protein
MWFKNTNIITPNPIAAMEDLGLGVKAEVIEATVMEE